MLPDLPCHSNGPYVPTDRFSLASSLNKAKIWLKLCNAEHKPCRFEGPKPLPTRIIDISSPTAIRLVTGAGKKAPYACLSHCWGIEPLLETTPDNFGEFERSIPWDRTPTTFRDAIEFARGLGLRYIWIDSLCIIQHDTGNPSDWQKESSRMASIYENSYVTLAAVTSKDSTISCFEGPWRSRFKPRTYPPSTNCVT